jgi:hypothetical protein
VLNNDLSDKHDHADGKGDIQYEDADDQVLAIDSSYGEDVYSNLPGREFVISAEGYIYTAEVPGNATQQLVLTTDDTNTIRAVSELALLENGYSLLVCSIDGSGGLSCLSNGGSNFQQCRNEHDDVIETLGGGEGYLVCFDQQQNVIYQ